MSSDRDDGRRHGGDVGDTAGQGGEPSPGRGAVRLNDLRARMRAIETGSRSADVDRSSRESSRYEAARPTDAQAPDPGRLAGQGGDSTEPRERAPKSVRDSQAPAPRPGRLSDDTSHPGDAAGPASRAVADVAAPKGDLASAQNTPETAFEHPFADGDGHLFDQSTSGPSRRERRRASREQSPTQRALGLLVRREHSRKELTRKLTSRGLDREQVVDAVDRLAEAGWQNDERFAETLVRSRANNGYGPVHIRAELGTHGLDGEAIAAAMAAFEGDWLENARDLLRRRFGEDYGDDPARRRKAADLLMRRGFEMETVRIASRSYAPD